ncbi:hypothetical protein PENTCL1PPCAC_13413 [Pristionchus entomophagus]|uniref:Uncharacterized protein n=1 Tax=Pristionchus entomophagus TaxID=358040 RepID=A0AAV5TAX7_9BILA|nr:hypothetical protein PENTCL1PPCAC_13413 [Pristionchus entomophagus]
MLCERSQMPTEALHVEVEERRVVLLRDRGSKPIGTQGQDEKNFVDGMCGSDGMSNHVEVFSWAEVGWVYLLLANESTERETLKCFGNERVKIDGNTCYLGDLENVSLAYPTRKYLKITISLLRWATVERGARINLLDFNWFCFYLRS